MSYWRQPWGRLELASRGCRLQVLDPDAAFTLEPQLIARLGDPLLTLLADPARAARGLGASVGRDLGVEEEITKAMRDPIAGIPATALALQRAAQLVSTAISELDLDGPWVVEVFSRIVLDRFQCEGQVVGTWREWTDLGLGWRARWLVLGAQLSQTFGPLWRRSPYKPGGREVEDYGVPEPNASKATQWAAQIAKLGLASSADEVLVAWTPERVVDVVETAAHDAEVERRHQAAAEAKRRPSS